MRLLKALSVGAAFALAACSASSQEDEQLIRGDTGGRMATVITTLQTGVCHFRWEGEPLSLDEMSVRVRGRIDDSVTAHNGVENMYESDIPYIRLEAAGEMSFRCVSLAIGTLREAGPSFGELRVTGESVNLRVNFEIIGYERLDPRRVIALDDEGRIHFEGVPISLNELPSKAEFGRETAVSGAAFIPASDIEMPEERYFLLPSAQTSFWAVVEVAKVLQESGETFTLASCFFEEYDTPFAEDQVGEPLPSC